MALPVKVISDIQAGYAYYSDLISEYIADLEKGCDCPDKDIKCLRQLLFGLSYKQSVGIFDEYAESMYYQMMGIIGGVSFVYTDLSVYAGADRSSPINIPQTFTATIQMGSYAIASILWTQVSGTPANLSGQNTATLNVSNFPLGPSSYKVTVTDTEGTIVSSTVVLTGQVVVTSTAYFLGKNTNVLPTLSELLAGTAVTFNLNTPTITIPYNSEDYLYYFTGIPNSEGAFNHYQNLNVPTDNGNIGTSDDLFNSSVAVGTYNVYRPNYAVRIVDPLRLERT